tara:strand:- start:357 stop:458 length:102 start_codon:yes stop_codon:yes gene_type:complete
MTEEDWPGSAKFRIFGWLAGAVIIGLCIYFTII